MPEPELGRGQIARVIADPSIRKLRRELAKTGKEVNKALRKELREAVRPVATKAKQYASYSRRIPRTIRPAADSRGPYVKAGSPKIAPHAGVWEGTREGQDRRHPVFATGPRAGWTWVTQPRKPYLARAARSEADEVANRVADAVQRAASQFALDD